MPSFFWKAKTILVFECADLAVIWEAALGEGFYARSCTGKVTGI